MNIRKQEKLPDIWAIASESMIQDDKEGRATIHTRLPSLVRPVGRTYECVESEDICQMSWWNWNERSS